MKRTLLASALLVSLAFAYGGSRNIPPVMARAINTNAADAAAISFTPLFVRIPGGSYAMGDHSGFVDPDHPSDEIPIHTVTISPLFMPTTLLTNREYCDYLNPALA